MNKIREDRESLQSEEVANCCPRSWKAKESVSVCKIQESAKM